MRRQVNTYVRFLFLSGCVLAVATTAAHKLIELQIHSAHQKNRITGEVPVRTERIHAQRGMIMDRNGELLTNNILNCSIIADRIHLRTFSLVLNGLSYNQAIHDPQWAQANEDEREEIIAHYKRRLDRQARRQLTQEEKNQLAQRKASLSKSSNDEYDPAICAQYFALHDQLVADIIFPYVNHLSYNNKSKEDLKAPPLEKQDIHEMIDQRQTQSYNEQARAQNRPTRTIQQRILLAKGLAPDRADDLREALKRARISGVSLETIPDRSYAVPEHLAHVVGYVNAKNVGINGIELSFNHHLAGVNGLREHRTNSRGQIIPNADDRYLPARHGLNIQLTIDMRIQRIVEEELDRGLRLYKAKRGCIIVVHPQTGDILAMASRPAYDLNTKDIITPNGRVPYNNTQGPQRTPLRGEFHYATQARYEPGSTFKVIALAAAIDKGLININTLINSNPLPIPGGGTVRDAYNYRLLPAWAILKKSSNPGTVRIARMTGWKSYSDYLNRFGVTRPTSIELPNGGGCLVADGENAVNFSRLAFGYSISVSPLHMAMVYATIANDGVRMKPRLIHKITDPDGKVFDPSPPVAETRTIKESTARSLRRALVSVTESKGRHGRGTATLAAIPGFDVAGKTGTSRKVKETGGYDPENHTVSFAGMIPADKPELVIMTVIDEARTERVSISGGTVAAPIFREVARRLIEQLQLTPDNEKSYSKYLQRRRREDPNRAY